MITAPACLFWLLLLTGLISANPADTIEYEASCTAAFRTNDSNLVATICEQQLVRAIANNNQKSVLKIYIALAHNFKDLSDYESFNRYMHLAENHPIFNTELAIKYDWLRLKAMRLHHTENLTQSKQLFQQALEIALQLKDDRKISNSNIDLGVSAKKRGDFKGAMKHFRTGLELTRQRNEPYATGLSLKSVGDVYMKLEEYPAAVTYYDEALMKYQQYSQQEHHDHRVQERIVFVYEKLALAHQKMGQTDTAESYSKMAQQSQFRLSSGHELASDMVHQAKSLIEAKDHSTAEQLLRQALHMFQAEGIDNPAEVHYLLAKVYQGQGHDAIAIDYAQKGLVNPPNDQTSNHINSQIFELLSQLYADTNPAQALQYANQYNQGRETFLNEKYNSDLTTIQHQIELEKNQNKLVTSQLEVIQQKVEIQTLNNRYLLSLLLLFCLLALIIYLYVKKRKQQAELQASISYHKNQLVVLSLSNQPKIPEVYNSNQPQITQTTVNEMLVQMMHDAINTWTELTGENLIELADRSKIWTITNDNGTLRTRSLEKYLSIQKIPQNPRWRNVVRTCHFVLAESGLDTNQRQKLNTQLESLIQLIKDYYGTAE